MREQMPVRDTLDGHSIEVDRRAIQRSESSGAALASTAAGVVRLGDICISSCP